MIDKMVVRNATILRSLPNFVDPSSFLRDLCRIDSLSVAKSTRVKKVKGSQDNVLVSP